MKPVLLILLIAIPLMTSAQQSDKVTVQLPSISMSEALTVLGISYNVRFSYSDDVIPLHVIVNLSIDNEPLTSALDKVLTPHGIVYKVVNSRIVLRKDPVLLTQIIRGAVIDQVTNAPIP